MHPGSSGSSVLEWNSSHECQRWDFEGSNKSTRSLGWGKRKAESSPELNQQVPLCISFYSVLSPTQHTHARTRAYTHTRTHAHHSGFDQRNPQNGEMMPNMSPRQRTYSFLQQHLLTVSGISQQSNQTEPYLAELLVIGLASEGSLTGGPLPLSRLLRKEGSKSPNPPMVTTIWLLVKETTAMALKRGLFGQVEQTSELEMPRGQVTTTPNLSKQFSFCIQQPGLIQQQ